MDIEEVKHYMRVDGNDDDEFIKALIGASKQYIENASGVQVDEQDELHKLAVKILCVHWYENRGAKDLESRAPMNYSIQSIINQITLTSSASQG